MVLWNFLFRSVHYGVSVYRFYVGKGGYSKSWSLLLQIMNMEDQFLSY